MALTQAQRAAIIQGAPVAVLRGDEAPRAGYAALRQWATRLFEQEWAGEVQNPIIGAVVVNAQSVRDSLAHRMNAYKAVAFAAIKNVLEHGVVIAKGQRNKTTDSYFVGAPIKIGDKENIVVVVVNKDAQSQRLYLHSVITKERLLTHLKPEAVCAITQTERNRVVRKRGVDGILDVPVSDSKLSMEDILMELRHLLTLEFYQ